MIEAKLLQATKVGNVWLIGPKDLEAVKDRTRGVLRVATRNFLSPFFRHETQSRITDDETQNNDLDSNRFSPALGDDFRRS